VLFTQFDNYVLIGIPHDRKKVIDTLSRNCHGERLKYFHGEPSSKFDSACTGLLLFV